MQQKTEREWNSVLDDCIAKLFSSLSSLQTSKKRALGEPVTGPLLQAKAKQFHARLNVDSNFSASNSWLARFKKRHGISLNIKGEKLSANEDDANAFREGLKAFLENHGYKLDNIYNGDETSFWKHFPTKTFIHPNLDVLVQCLAPAHPSSTELNEIDPQFFVVYLAPNVTSLIQPVDQGVISALKRRYKTMFLNELLAKEFEEKGSVDEFIKKWNVRDCFHLLQNAWDSVTIDTLNNSWKNLLQLNLAGPLQTQTVALLEVIRRIPGCGEMSLKEVENWMDKDQYEPPYKVFNDSQLIEIAKGGIEESDSEEELLNSNNNKDSDEESPNFPPPSLDEVLPSILQIRHWSRGNKIVTVE
ncbi:hypothetical protein NQ318_014421 [Aromia moschata]|uniref:HTH CENPB-type domain-containing protein n=1 Tax=Aromia moschata TaxID=1265417 RepID=A0AAV8Y7U3_9CUCU|nr:hypothetical protein NQ318_014421 [Aromia moschata]